VASRAYSNTPTLKSLYEKNSTCKSCSDKIKCVCNDKPKDSADQIQSKIFSATSSTNMFSNTVFTFGNTNSYARNPAITATTTITEPSPTVAQISTISLFENNWKCKECLYENQIYREKCVICETPSDNQNLAIRSRKILKPTFNKSIAPQVSFSSIPKNLIFGSAVTSDTSSSLAKSQNSQVNLDSLSQVKEQETNSLKISTIKSSLNTQSATEAQKTYETNNEKSNTLYASLSENRLISKTVITNAESTNNSSNTNTWISNSNVSTISSTPPVNASNSSASNTILKNSSEEKSIGSYFSNLFNKTTPAFSFNAASISSGSIFNDKSSTLISNKDLQKNNLVTTNSVSSAASSVDIFNEFVKQISLTNVDDSKNQQLCNFGKKEISSASAPGSSIINDVGSIKIDIEPKTNQIIAKSNPTTATNSIFTSSLLRSQTSTLKSNNIASQTLKLIPDSTTINKFQFEKIDVPLRNSTNNSVGEISMDEKSIRSDKNGS
jgi:hypothetical protein